MVMGKNTIPKFEMVLVSITVSDVSQGVIWGHGLQRNQGVINQV